MTDPAPPAGRNHLAHETSPYLLQHAGNPVDWYPWGDEAFAKARAEQKPVILSVGYSTCHWCHVMAHESFEDESIAALMNESFVSIKVDREERPDIDSVYMTFTQALTGQGGWPMTVFLTPDAQPFYAGTYFPPDDNHGRPGFRRVLDGIRTAWSEDPDRLRGSAADLTNRLREALARRPLADAANAVGADVTHRALERLRGSYDFEWGGFGTAPKFPSPGSLEFLLMHDARVGDAEGEPTGREMALHTLRRMTMGGMYDQLGGGFSRYSVDRQWLVPHFEKMLYDNAQLARVYLHAHQVTGEPLFERIARETLDYLAREMLDPAGGFYAAQDADSEGVEGKFFVWTQAEVEEVLGTDAVLFNTYFSVIEAGNFEDPHHPELGRSNVLSRQRTDLAVAREWRMSEPDLAAKIADLRERMRLAREERVHPGRDEKILTSWNGLALAAFAEAARVLGDERYRAIAERNAAYLRDRVWRDGRLLHSFTRGEARIDGMLEDYAYAGLGLVELYRTTGDLAHLQWADTLFDAAVARFHDDSASGGAGGFFEAPTDGEALIVRQKPLFDAATPSGNGAMALLGFWLGRTFERPAQERVIDEVAALAGDALVEQASGFGSVLQAIELRLAPRREIAIVGDAAARAPFERALARHYLPAAVIAPSAGGEGLPLLAGRAVEDGAAAYVCEDMVCDLPARTPDALAAQLSAG